MKAIILAGGAGTRLHPATSVISKQLLSVYDKPMIYYAVATAITAGATELLIISSPEFLPFYEKLFRNGRQLGLPITYEQQRDPQGGIAEAFIIGAGFIGSSSVMLMLGDNIFVNVNTELLAIPLTLDGAYVFACKSSHPQDFGVITFGNNSEVLDIAEKPESPKSDWIVPGLYAYAPDVVEISRSLTRSDRGQLEITTVNQAYLAQGRLTAVRLPEDVQWFDCGTPDELLAAANYISDWEKSHHVRVGCPAEASFRRRLIDEHRLLRLIRSMKSETHRGYLRSLVSRSS